MSKTFSDTQIQSVNRLIDLQRNLDNRIENVIQETLLRKDLNDNELKEILDSLRNSLKYEIAGKL